MGVRGRTWYLLLIRMENVLFRDGDYNSIRHDSKEDKGVEIKLARGECKKGGMYWFGIEGGRYHLSSF